MADLIAVQCSQCGGESPFSLATPDRLSCDYCGFVGPLPESARHSLYYAAQVLPQLDASQRTLSVKHRRALQLDSGAKVVRNIVIVLVLVALLVLDLALVGVVVSGFNAFIATSVGIVTTPSVIGAVVLVLREGKKARAELMRLYAAAAPVRQGAPTRCRVCGAVLPSESHGGVVSCAYCGSDNLVAPEVLARATWNRTRSVEEYKAQLDARATSAFTAAAGGTVFVIAAAFAAPFVSLFAAVLVVVVGKGFEDADQTIQYVAVRTDGRWCVTDKQPPSSVPSGDIRGPFTVQALIGRKIHHEGRELKAVDAKRHRGRPGNILHLATITDRPVSGSCLVGEPP